MKFKHLATGNTKVAKLSIHGFSSHGTGDMMDMLSMVDQSDAFMVLTMMLESQTKRHISWQAQDIFVLYIALKRKHD